jgi:hypothetical protein
MSALEDGLMGDAHSSNVAWVRFVAFRNDQPSWWDEQEVSRFHEIVTALEGAYGLDLSAFHIPDSEMKHQIVGVQRAPRSGRHAGRKQMSEKRYCDDRFARRQVEGIWLYFQSLQPPPERPKFGFGE